MIDPAAITSRRNPQIVAAAALHSASERRTRGRTLLEGPRLVAEASAGGARIETVFALAGTEMPSRGTSPVVLTVTQPVLERLSGTRSPTGPVAVIEIPPDSALEHRRTVVLAGVSDPGNAGTLIRSAAAFDYQVVVSEGSVDPWAPKVLRAAAGGHFGTSVVRIGESLGAALEDAGLTAVALTAHGGGTLGDRIEGVPAFLVGSEAHGLPEGIHRLATQELTIPLEAAESLNAAVAGSIAMYQYR